MTWISARPCRRPISKSFGSCAGVTFSAPVPTVGSTYSSAMIGTSRSTSGTIARRPTSVAVALVGGVHGDRRVAEQRHGAHRRDRHVTAADERVVDLVHDVLDVAVLDLEIRDRGEQAGRPVDHPVVAEEIALAIELDEHLEHRARVVVVHREALAAEVERGAEAQVLPRDRRAGLAPPLPQALEEQLAAELLARRALGRQQPLDHHLRRDARVVGAVDPERVAAAHAVQADQHVVDRAVQRVAHVQRARHVRRRDRDRVRLAGIVRVRLERAVRRSSAAGPRARRGTRRSASARRAVLEDRPPHRES